KMMNSFESYGAGEYKDKKESKSSKKKKRPAPAQGILLPNKEEAKSEKSGWELDLFKNLGKEHKDTSREKDKQEKADDKKPEARAEEQELERTAEASPEERAMAVREYAEARSEDLQEDLGEVEPDSVEEAVTQANMEFIESVKE